MASGKSEAHRIFTAIDSLLGNRKPQSVLEITESLVRKEPADWEALYRRGVALYDLNKLDEAARSFQAILDVTKGDDEKSALARARARDPKLQAAGARPSSVGRQGTVPLEDRVGQVFSVRQACKIEVRQTISRTGPMPSWGPPDFGQARMAAMGWLVTLAQKQGQAKADELVARLRKAAHKTPPDPRHLGLVLPVCASLRQRRVVRGGQAPFARHAHRSTRPVGLSPRIGRPAKRDGPAILCLSRRGAIEGSHSAPGSRRDRAGSLDLPFAAHATARAGPGADSPECLGRACSGQARGGRRALLPRDHRRLDFACANRRRIWPGCQARRCGGPPGAGRSLRAAPSRPSEHILLYGLILLLRTGHVARPGHVSSGRSESV